MKAGVTARQWQRWESGASIPYARNLSAVADAFGFDVAEFYDGPAGQEPAATPDPFGGETQLDRIERRLDSIETLLRQVFEHRSDQGSDIIERLDGLEANVNIGLNQLEKALNANAAAEAGKLVDGIAAAWKAGKLPALPPASPKAAAKPGTKRTRAA